MSVTIELVYDSGCPNVEDARTNLRRALRQMSLDVSWREWNRRDPELPEHARRRGSPTVLVDGRDVVREATEPNGACCRLYEGEGGYRRAPPIAAIVAALRRSRGG